MWFSFYFRDSLLLEAGFLTILVAPLHALRSKANTWVPHDGITFWLIRWLLFRLMFASGIVKLTSRCPTWWGLTGEASCVTLIFLLFSFEILFQFYVSKMLLLPYHHSPSLDTGSLFFTFISLSEIDRNILMGRHRCHSLRSPFFVTSVLEDWQKGYFV